MPTSQKKFSPAGCAVKVIAGAIFVGTLIGLAVLAATNLLPEEWQMPWLIGGVGAIALVIGVELATVILARGEPTPFGILGPKGKHLTVSALRSKGQLASDSFRAKRAFAVEETNDEGSHYFIELDDGSVLYLNGQYLFDYEAIEEPPPDDEFNQPRLFPTTEFTVLRNRQSGYVVEIELEGTVLAPEAIYPPFTNRDWKEFGILSDGEVISDRSYDALKASRSASQID